MPLPASDFVWTAYVVPKQGHVEAECEDAYACNPLASRFAVADGASETAFARPWAEALAEGYVTHRGPWSSWLPAVRADWKSRFEGQTMPWYVETKFQEGAFATLLGVRFHRDSRRQSWQALAVGDSCLFQVRNDRLRRAFPVRHAADFNHDRPPTLIGSRAPSPHPVKRRRARGTWRSNDVFLLATDALAEWFLREAEDGGQPWNRLVAVDAPDAFAALVEELRRAKKLRNDDATLVRITHR